MNQSFDSSNRWRSPAGKHLQNQTGNSFLSRLNNSSRPQSRHIHYLPDSTIADFNKVSYYENKKNTERSLDLTNPQRLELPLYFNTPVRIQQVHKPTISPATNSAFMLLRQQKGKKSESMPKRNLQVTEREEGQLKGLEDFQRTLVKHANKRVLKCNIDTNIKIPMMKRFQDYKMLGLACRRAGKIREEGRSYYSMGVLCDNLGKYKQALAYYRHFLSVCNAIGDTHGEALAYNCLGVNYQILGDFGDRGMWEKAIDAHLKHRGLSDDAGKFIAHVNLGITYEKLGDQKNSMIHHQQALRFAQILSNPKDQSIALANLGRIGRMEQIDNPLKTQLFIEKYIHICEEMNDQQNQSKGYYKLGQLLTEQKNFDASIENYKKVIESSENNTELRDWSKAGLGISLGLKNLDSEISEIQTKIIKQ